MINILSENWCTEPPYDYELKKYQLLGAIQQLEKEVESGNLFHALIDVESGLYMFYKFQSSKNELEDKMKILKGINLDTMSLDYEYPEQSKEISDVHKLCEFAIDEFEAVFKNIRAKWRSLSKKISLSEIPSSRPTKTKGQILVNNKDQDTIVIYEYLTMSSKDWRDLNLVKVGEIKNEIGEISTYIQNLEDSDNYRFWRSTYDLDIELEDNLIHIIKYNLFFKIISA